MPHYPRILIALTLLTLAPVSAPEAAAYKWVDENGVTQYSQMPPPNTPVEIIKTPPRTAAPPQIPAASAPATPAQPNRPSAKARAEDVAVRAENCANARNNLEILQTRPRVSIKDANGLYHRLDDAERQTNIEEAQKRIAEFCTE